ncbi:S1 family peptidase [Streptomyces sp. MI02-7b]|uniref:S1 family peptidase n=1 Tax=Streptomyces sp. MI02-7b TaxID=462941 RepID=UPI0029A93F07|nr:S1 family peptidase [Streptomyces sp. MI02-7b]MDX3073877.1 S1 family peptidase [Streptomyces sp. MI02-7b]
MRRRTSARTGLSALLVLAGLGGSLTSLSAAASTASASAAGTSARVTAPAAAELAGVVAGDLGLTRGQARERLRDEAAATRLEPTARRAAGAAYGGSWYDADSGRPVVAVVGTRGAEAVRGTGAAARLVRHTAGELDAVKAGLDRAARAKAAPSGVTGWRVDPRANRVVVDVRAGAERVAATEAFVARARRAAPYAVVTSVRPAGRAPVTLAAGTVGGDPYYSHNIRCSIGFSVHGGFVTAGHCAQLGAAVSGWDGSSIGAFRGGTFPGNDYGWVDVGSGWWTVPVALGWGAVPDALVRGSAEAPVGASVCRSGSTTHWPRGTVLARNETVNCSQGSVFGLTRTNVCAEPGDSGGSFISGDQAQGVTSGGWGNCSSGGETWFQPVNPILSRYGLTLHTA